MNKFDTMMEELNSKYQMVRLSAIQEIINETSKAVNEIGGKYRDMADEFIGISHGLTAKVDEIECDGLDYTKEYCDMVYSAKDYAAKRAAKMVGLLADCRIKETELLKICEDLNRMISNLNDFVVQFELEEKPILVNE